MTNDYFDDEELDEESLKDWQEKMSEPIRFEVLTPKDYEKKQKEKQAR